jgi:hypothetical protein
MRKVQKSFIVSDTSKSTMWFFEVFYHYTMSGEAWRFFREKLENAAAGYSDELAHLDLLQCAIVTELIDTSLRDSHNGGNLFAPQQCLAV